MRQANALRMIGLYALEVQNGDLERDEIESILEIATDLLAATEKVELRSIRSSPINLRWPHEAHQPSRSS